MTFQWESSKERLLRFMKIPAQQKMEWLYQMHEFMLRTSNRRLKAIRLELRKKRQAQCPSRRSLEKAACRGKLWQK